MEEKEKRLSYGGVDIEPEENRCRFLIKGELDHHSVKEIRSVIDGYLIDYRPLSVTLDLGEVTFTDSAGLGLIMGRYARIRDYGGTLDLVHVGEDFMRILRLAGVERFLTIEGKTKQKKELPV